MRRLTFTLVLAVAATVLTGGAAMAAAPKNNSMAIPAILSVTTLSGATGADNTQATFVGEPTPSCQPNIGHTVWWRYRPEANMSAKMDTIGSDFDTVLAVYRSTATGLVQVACSDDYNGATSKLEFTAAVATTYYIQIGGWSALTGSIVFHYSFKIYNDTFARARTISPGFSATYSNASAGLQAGEPTGCSGAGKTVWFRYQTSTTRRVTFDTFDSEYDTQVSVYRGTALTGLTFIKCADDTDETNGDGSVSWTAQPGQTYYIQVGGYQGVFGKTAVNFVRRP